MLDACDRLGMLVMDEAFDVWTERRSPFDYCADASPSGGSATSRRWSRKDLNHPSVIFYSIGNEIPETGHPLGASWAARLAEKVRALDDTRFVTNGINGARRRRRLRRGRRHRPSGRRRRAEDDGSTTLMGDAGGLMNAIAVSDWSPSGPPSPSPCSTSPA